MRNRDHTRHGNTGNTCGNIGNTLWVFVAMLPPQAPQTATFVASVANVATGLWRIFSSFLEGKKTNPQPQTAIAILCRFQAHNGSFGSRPCSIAVSYVPKQPKGDAFRISSERPRRVYPKETGAESKPARLLSVRCPKVRSTAKLFRNGRVFLPSPRLAHAIGSHVVCKKEE
jgi:hypothetical protein